MTNDTMVPANTKRSSPDRDEAGEGIGCKIQHHAYTWSKSVNSRWDWRNREPRFLTRVKEVVHFVSNNQLVVECVKLILHHHV